ncbi:hypothetical protein PR048_022826 [Dryococelus australis]|uniref:Uncharacterized protein n=1 Tax=Dryococelus australis TaxID=614101 RepID=A0ABQ9GSB2_9NEOP|nr:hypothetical protein PR048_022826 [Dryococelus australis]
MEQRRNEKVGRNGRSTRKPADQRHRLARFQHVKIRRGGTPSWWRVDSLTTIPSRSPYDAENSHRARLAERERRFASGNTIHRPGQEMRYLPRWQSACFPSYRLTSPPAPGASSSRCRRPETEYSLPAQQFASAETTVEAWPPPVFSSSRPFFRVSFASARNSSRVEKPFRTRGGGGGGSTTVTRHPFSTSLPFKEVTIAFRSGLNVMEAKKDEFGRGKNEGSLSLKSQHKTSHPTVIWPKTAMQKFNKSHVAENQLRHPSSVIEEATVAQWLGRSSSNTEIRARSPAGSLPDFRMWESCWTMPLTTGFSRGTPASPAPAFQRRSNLGSHVMYGDDGHIRVPAGNSVTRRVLPRPGFTSHSSNAQDRRGDMEQGLRPASRRGVKKDLGRTYRGPLPRRDAKEPSASRLSEFDDLYARLHRAVYTLASDVCSLAAAPESSQWYSTPDRMWLECWPSTLTNRDPNPGGVAPGFFSCGNCTGRCPWLAGFLGDLQFTPPLHSCAASYPAHSTLIGYQDLVVRIRSNFFTHTLSLNCVSSCSRVLINRIRFRKCRLPGKNILHPPRRAGFNPRPGHRIFASGNRAGRCRGSPVSPAPSFQRRSIFTPVVLIGAQELAVKSRPHLFNQYPSCALYECTVDFNTISTQEQFVSCQSSLSIAIGCCLFVKAFSFSHQASQNSATSARLVRDSCADSQHINRLDPDPRCARTIGSRGAVVDGYGLGGGGREGRIEEIGSPVKRGSRQLPVMSQETSCLTFLPKSRSSSVGRETDSGAAVAQWVENPIVGPQ